MSLWNDLFGTTSKANSGTNTVNTQNETQTGTSNNQNNSTTSSTNSTTGSSSTATNTNTTGSQTTSTLDANTQALLQSLLPQLAGNVSAGAGGNASNSDAAKTISAILTAKGTGGNDAALNDTITAGQNTARASYATGEGAQVNQIAQQIGSKGNTYSQLVDQQGQKDLATSLDQVAVNARNDATKQNSSDLLAALQGLQTSSSVGATDANSAVTPLATIINLLKGANTTTDQSQTTAGSSDTTSSQLSSILQSIFGTSNTQTDSTAGATTTGQSNTQGSQTSSPGIIPGILSLFP